MGTAVVEPGSELALPWGVSQVRDSSKTFLFLFLLFFPVIVFLFWLTYICFDLLPSCSVSFSPLFISFYQSEAFLKSDSPRFGPQYCCYLLLKCLEKSPLPSLKITFFFVKWDNYINAGLLYAVYPHRNFNFGLLRSHLHPQGLETSLTHSR